VSGIVQGVLTFYSLDKPQEDPNIRGDAFKTLIVARLSYDATEQDLESEFGRFGPIERVRIFSLSVLDQANQSLTDPDCCRHSSR
jgi:RNA recognition motif-containing protein